MKKILITGATGLVGGAIYRYLCTDKKLDILCISSKSQENESFIKCDLSVNDLDLKEKCGRCDIIVHCAAVLPNDVVDQTSGDQTRAIDQNVYYYACDTGAAVIYISSAFCYKLTENKYKQENDPLYRHSVYHSAKIDGEGLFRSLAERAIIARISSPYGNNMKVGNVISIFVDAAKSGQDIEVHNDGKRMQDFIHADDIAEFIYKAIYSWQSGIYNVVSASPSKILDLAKVCASVGMKSQVISRSVDNSDQPYYPLFSNKKALDVYGWLPRVSLEEGLERIIHDSN